MKTVVLALFLVCGIRAEPQAQQVLDRVRKAYTSLQAFHGVAVREVSILGRPGSLQSMIYEMELAEKAGGMYRTRIKAGDQDSISVSDGAKTWRALPKAKQWSEWNAAGLNLASAGVSGAGASGAEPSGDDAKPPVDLHSIVKDAIFLRYVAIAKLGKDPLLLKEENVKVGKEKRPCHVVRTHVQNNSYDLWVDQGNGFVLQDIEISRPESAKGSGEARTTTKMKVLEVNDAVDQSAFRFEPESSWKQVDMLILPGEDRTVLVGAKAGNFTAKSLDGDTVELNALRGKAVVLDFWATWCPPCREELPEIDQLRSEFGDRVQFFGVNDEDPGTVKSFLRKKNNGLPTLMDARRTVHRQYGVSAIPTLLVIDREGVVRTHFIGSRSLEALRAAIAQVADR